MNTHTIDANVEGLVRLAVRPDLRSKIRQQALLQQELQLDSIDLVCLAIDLEDFFRIVISDEAIASWRTVADISETVANAAPMPAPRVAQPDYAALGLGRAEEAEGRN